MASVTASKNLSRASPLRRTDSLAGALRTPGSLTQRMILLAAVWIAAMLAIGGYAVDRVLSASLRSNFDAELGYALTAMIASAEVGPEGEVRFDRPLGDQRYFEPYSGLYWQVSAPGHDPFPSRSLWDRRMVPHWDRSCATPCTYSSMEFAGEPLRVVASDARLPGSRVVWRFAVASADGPLQAQVRALRSQLWWWLGMLGAGLFALAAAQAAFAMRPLRRLGAAVAAIRSGAATRVPADTPPEVAPLVGELNMLLDASERQAESARTHAGNLAHALKTPMSVLLNEAETHDGALARTVVREVGTMRRQVDHHLARARAMGRRSQVSARAEVWPALESVARAVTRMHADQNVLIDIDGDRNAVFRGERQDLDEMLGNLIDNAAKYGRGRVFVTVARAGPTVAVAVEDDGPGVPAAERDRLFGRGARLDTGKPGTGLGLAIVRDVAEIYGGSVALDESEDLGGLCATLSLPAAE